MQKIKWQTGLVIILAIMAVTMLMVKVSWHRGTPPTQRGSYFTETMNDPTTFQASLKITSTQIKLVEIRLSNGQSKTLVYQNISYKRVTNDCYRLKAIDDGGQRVAITLKSGRYPQKSVYAKQKRIALKLPKKSQYSGWFRKN